MPPPKPAGITTLLQKLSAQRADRREISDRVFEVVYDELKRAATALMAGERAGHTLQPTALVHEAYVRLVGGGRVEWKNRAHFFGIAARAMRQILVEHARRHAAAKRGGGWERVTLDERLGVARGAELKILHLDDALKRLAKLDHRMSQVVELRFFGGLTSKEVAGHLGVSKRTVDDDWSVAKKWLRREIHPEDD